MKRSMLIVLGLIALAAIVTAPAFSQVQKEPAAQPAPAPSAPEAPAAPAASELSIYGEVQAVDSAANSLGVQYYDYDSDEEKEITISLDKDTKIENAANISEVKKGDWVDVSYAVKDGKNLAKSIVVEKEEAISSEDTQTPPTVGVSEEAE